jgi:hypothetical protein
MKTLILSLLLAHVAAIMAVANPGTKKPAAATPQATVEQQLAHCLTYPQALQATQQPSTVVVQFQLDERNRLTRLRVFTNNQQLTDELTRQLTNVPIQPTEPVAYVQRTYTARLRFQKV